MQTGTATEPKKRTKKGRQDSEGTEAVIKFTELSDELQKLDKLCRAVNDAQEDYDDAITRAADKSGLLATTVKKFIAARCSDKFDEKKRKALQLALVFENVG